MLINEKLFNSYQEYSRGLSSTRTSLSYIMRKWPQGWDARPRQGWRWRRPTGGQHQSLIRWTDHWSPWVHWRRWHRSRGSERKVNCRTNRKKNSTKTYNNDESSQTFGQKLFDRRIHFKVWMILNKIWRKSDTKSWNIDVLWVNLAKIKANNW